MRIWLISIFEQTPIDKVFSTRFNSIGNEAVKRGHKITFFASTFKHNTKNQRFEKTTKVKESEDFELVFIQSPSYSGNISVKRLKAHYDFAKEASKEIENHTEPDVILMAFPPITLSAEISTWARKKNIPVIIDIIDPWPSTFTIAVPGILKPVARLATLPMVRNLKKTLRNVSAVTAISQQYIDWAGSFYSDIPRTQVFYPASDFELMRYHIEKWKNKLSKDPEKLTLIYAGSFSKSYDLRCILEAAGSLEKDFPDITFKFAGAGPQEEDIRKYCASHSNAELLGRLNKDDLMKQYYLSDLGFTQHIKGATQSVTYKLFDLLSAGLPILNSLESEMKEIIVNNKVGLHNEPGNSMQLRENILYFYNNKSKIREYRENGFELTKKAGENSVVYGGFVDLLESISNN